MSRNKERRAAVGKVAGGILGWRRLLIAVATAALATPAFAHHSGAMFDPAKTVTLQGTVKEFQYTNPHSWLEVVVMGSDGQAVEWGFEAEGPSTLLRAGIKAKTFMPGDKVTGRRYTPMEGQTSRPAGSLMSATKADGTVVSPRGNAAPANGAPGRRDRRQEAEADRRRQPRPRTVGMQPFIYAGVPSRVVFGSRRRWAEIADEVEGALAAPGRWSCPRRSRRTPRATWWIGWAACAPACSPRRPCTRPVEITERAMQVVAETSAPTATVALGGGSTTGLGKAIALRTDLPQIVIPTTYAGSEATPILGETQGGLKTTQRSLKILPEVILYDVDLTLTLPVGLSATSGMNAIAHAVEGLYTQDANPVVSLMAEEGIRALGIRPCRGIASRSGRPRGPLRTPSTAPWLCGRWCWARSGMVPCITSSATPWAGPSTCRAMRETHTVVLPHAAAYNAAAAPEAMARIARALGVKGPLRRACTIWPRPGRADLALKDDRHAARTASTGPPTWLWPTPTGIPARSRTGGRAVVARRRPSSAGVRPGRSGHPGAPVHV